MGTSSKNGVSRFVFCFLLAIPLYFSLNHLNDVSRSLQQGDSGQDILSAVYPGAMMLPNHPWIPTGRAQALPSVQTTETIERGIYGGENDKSHLGGFTELDLHGISPSLWKHLVEQVGVKSMMDVGCGKGISTAWFHLHNVTSLCVEGSHHAYEQSVLRQVAPDNMIEHDFSRGPWWPKDTYDMVWSVELLEHIGVPFMYNYIQTFRKAAIILVTSSRWGGWHHVEVHQDDWWIRKYQSFGFIHDKELTDKFRRITGAERRAKITAPNGKAYNAQHLTTSLKVFINPLVASLPEHAHLFFEHGCFNSRDKGHRECGTGRTKDAKIETKLPDSFYPLTTTTEQDQAWTKLVQKNLKKQTTS